MSAMSLRVSRPFMVTDLEAMPDDGRRYEPIDGDMLVSPRPAADDSDHPGRPRMGRQRSWP
jgi:hypothetical protein